MSEPILDMDGGGGVFNEATIQRATDPVQPNATSSPADFAAQYPTPLDTTELLPFCEDITVWRAIPEERTGLQAYTWREMSALQWVTGSNLIAFADGYCPEEYAHTGTNSTVTLKNIGAYKALTISDILHSQAVAGADWNGINRLLGGFPASEGIPGGLDVATFQAEHVANLKEKEMRLAATLVMNGWDRLLVAGDATTRPLEFDGIEGWFTNVCSGEHTNSNTASGTFSGISFDRFLSESCAKPTHVFGHSTAIQEMLSAYFQLGYQGSQVVNFSDGDRIVPGFNFAGSVNTGIGRLTVVADDNFTRADAGGGAFQTTLYALRMVHNGDPLVYKITQVPLSFKDLAPGCTAIAFQIWAKTALIIKMCCAHGAYTTQMTGRVSVTECTSIG
jgi:hypothetical protein